MTTLAERLAATVVEHGPLRFDRFMDAALYEPVHGFYAGGGEAGRRGDFLTSVEVGPLFGALVARHLDLRWEAAGRPDRFVVVEAAAGRGALARAVLAAAPACTPALVYVLDERSAALAARQHEWLEVGEGPPAGAGGPWVRSVGGAAVAPPSVDRGDTDDVVRGPVHVVLANELLDNLAVRVLERTPSGWAEVHVDVETEPLHGGSLGSRPDDRAVPPERPPDGPRRFVEQLVEADDVTAARAATFAPDAAVGARVPLADAAVAWVGAARGRLAPGGELVVLDYGRPTAELATVAPTAWLRTYRRHERGGSPLDDPGSQDITADVAWDQLLAAHRGGSLCEQRAWLAALGIDDLVADGRRVWHERAHLGDLEALRARSRVREAEALCDPVGLGAFTVARWTADPAPRGGDGS